MKPVNTFYQHPFSTPPQPTLSTHIINLPYQSFLSTHTINQPSQPTLPPPPLSPPMNPPQPTISPLVSTLLSTHHINPPQPTISPLISPPPPTTTPLNPPIHPLNPPIHPLLSTLLSTLSSQPSPQVDLVESHAYNFQKEVGYDLFAQCEEIARRLGARRPTKAAAGTSSGHASYPHYLPIYPINNSYQHTLSTYHINPPTLLLNASSHPNLSTHLLNPPLLPPSHPTSPRRRYDAPRECQVLRRDHGDSRPRQGRTGRRTSHRTQASGRGRRGFVSRPKSRSKRRSKRRPKGTNGFECTSRRGRGGSD